MAYLGLNPEAYVSKIKEIQDISSQFDGVTNNFLLLLELEKYDEVFNFLCS